jgi:hypothetical protein
MGSKWFEPRFDPTKEEIVAGNSSSGQPGDERDPERTCTGNGGECNAWPVRGFEVCRAHGAGTPASKAIHARGTIAELAAKEGIELPDVKPRDFQRVVAEMVAWNVHHFAALSADLESLRLLHSPVHHAREYGDILDRLDQWGRTIATLTKAAAALPVPAEEAPKPPPVEHLRAVLEGIAGRMGVGVDGKGLHCPTCSCGAVAGSVVGEPVDDTGPMAEVLPWPTDDTSPEAP